MDTYFLRLFVKAVIAQGCDPQLVQQVNAKHVGQLGPEKFFDG